MVYSRAMAPKDPIDSDWPEVPEEPPPAEWIQRWIAADPGPEAEPSYPAQQFQRILERRVSRGPYVRETASTLSWEDRVRLASHWAGWDTREGSSPIVRALLEAYEGGHLDLAALGPLWLRGVVHATMQRHASRGG